MDVIARRDDRSGTLLARLRPDRYGMAPEPLVVGRVADVLALADRIGLLAHALR